MSNTILSFGKYKDLEISEVWEKDEQYCKWLYPQEMLIESAPGIKDFLLTKLNGVDLSYTLNWGKYKGKTINQVKTRDAPYLAWLLKSGYVVKKCPKLLQELKELMSGDEGGWDGNKVN